MPYTKSSKEEVKNMLSDDKTLKTLKDEYKKRVINTEEASDNLKTNIGKRIIALALTVAFGSGIISLVASMSKKTIINPTNPTISTTNPTTPTTRPTSPTPTTRPTSPTPTTRPADPTIPSSSPETILPNHEKLANNLVGPNLSKDELEKLVMYINISDYTNTNISISVEDLYTNYTNCIDEILITKNIIISGEAFFLFLFNVCNSFIAFRPKAVAPFPAPNIFNTIFITI